MIVNGGVVIQDRVIHSSRGSDAVSRARARGEGEGEGNGFIGFDLRINCWIDRDGGAGGTSGETHRPEGGPGGIDTGVIDAAGGGAAQGVVNGQTVAGIASSGEGVDDVATTILCYRRWRNGECDDWVRHFEIKADRNGQVVIGFAGLPLIGVGIGAEDEVLLTRCIGAGCGDCFGLGISAAGGERRLIGRTEASYVGI